MCNLSFVEWGRLGTPRDAKSTLMFSVFAVFMMECVPLTAHLEIVLIAPVLGARFELRKEARRRLHRRASLRRW